MRRRGSGSRRMRTLPSRRRPVDLRVDGAHAARDPARRRRGRSRPGRCSRSCGSLVSMTSPSSSISPRAIRRNRGSADGGGGHADAGGAAADDAGLRRADLGAGEAQLQLVAHGPGLGEVGLGDDEAVAGEGELALGLAQAGGAALHDRRGGVAGLQQLLGAVVGEARLGLGRLRLLDAALRPAARRPSPCRRGPPAGRAGGRSGRATGGRAPGRARPARPPRPAPR